MLTLFHAPHSRSMAVVSLIDEMGISDYVAVQIIDIRRQDGSGRFDPANPHPEHKAPALVLADHLLLDRGQTGGDGRESGEGLQRDLFGRRDKQPDSRSPPLVGTAHCTTRSGRGGKTRPFSLNEGCKRRKIPTRVQKHTLSREDVMDGLNRRSAMTLGLSVVAATPLALLPGPAASEMYAADAGKEVMPGIRQVELGEWPVNFGGYKRAVANDYVMGPGTAFPEETMKNDMLCQIMEGEIVIDQDGTVSRAKVGHVYSCMIGTVETDKNEGATAAIMRVIDLFPA